ncbi:MAG TPA: FAD-dependent oxidoreductase [Hydrogenophaga sp.]|mgnify:CR=1 FL=1|uniref:FAD-dependent oxidoreductase n=1 Tax=Hydrogenophaga sp. TaxID=1904254 RepID=UPI002CE5DF5D|nr:FAD-dependent oxidoreductase [Hydrogenophaga sp.]HMN93834.1 FAD-dependent oxidoreductase [Hydrogenophaga sp.]HMP09849.1 FAD-dependent oxidoreductase [Hydrogenophaga sp.]
MGTRLKVGIAGAGVLGRLLAWQLGRAGHAVTVFDPGPGPQAPETGSLTGRPVHAAGFTAAGMLSPIAELDNAGPALARLGWRSLALWRSIAEQLRGQGCSAPLFAQHGSLLLAHGADLGAARRVLARLEAATALASELPAPQVLDRASLGALEPAVTPGLHAWLLPDEAQVMSRDMLQALAVHAPNVHWCWGERVDHVDPGRITLVDGDALAFDLAIDVRGVGARPDRPLRGAPSGCPPRVRGVRGEVLWLHAPGVQLRRPLRLLHPRHRVYIVPRPGDLFIVGASEIESEDRSPVSLRSAVELMAAAHSALPGLAEARIVHMETNLRPALPDNEPHTHIEHGLLRINGLFRHGWLLAPALTEDAIAELTLAPLRGLSQPMADTHPC